MHWAKKLRAKDPARADKLVLHLFGGEGATQLTVTVSDKQGIKGYGFAYDGVPVGMKGGKGTFNGMSGDGDKLLEWVMVGDAGSTMKVVVAAGTKTVATREKSEIPPPGGKGYDALKIKVP